MIFLNGFTAECDAVAEKPADMSDERFAEVERACREGDAYSVADDYLTILAANPKHDDCFLVPSPKYLISTTWFGPVMWLGTDACGVVLTTDKNSAREYDRAAAERIKSGGFKHYELEEV